MATRLGVADALVGIHDAGNNVVGALGSILAVLSVLALVATMGLNAYSGMLTVVTAVDAVRPVAPTRQLRVVTILVLSVLWLLGGLLLTDAVSSLNNALLGMLYLLAPWTAINLLDFFLLRHGHYAITDLFTPDGIYGSWNRWGVLSYLAAVAVEVPFANIPGFYSSWGAGRLHGVDISWLLGMLVGGGLYALLVRGSDLSAERPAIERSDRVLATTGAAR
jgi:purine-cytosine permease-like protein